jgi:hypothetical protein
MGAGHAQAVVAPPAGVKKILLLRNSSGGPPQKIFVEMRPVCLIHELTFEKSRER